MESISDRLVVICSSVVEVIEIIIADLETIAVNDDVKPLSVLFSIVCVAENGLLDVLILKLDQLVELALGDRIISF